MTFKKRTIIALALLGLAGNNLPGCAHPNANLMRSYSDQVKLLRQAILKADNLLYGQMQRTADLLEKFYRQAGRLPEQGLEQESFRALILRKAPANPYRPQVIINDSKPFDKPLDLRFVTDGALSETSINRARENPPSLWRAEPGTITVITNGSGLFLVWGATADQTPMRSFITEKPRFVVRDINNQLGQKPPLSEQ